MRSTKVESACPTSSTRSASYTYSLRTLVDPGQSVAAVAQGERHDPPQDAGVLSATVAAHDDRSATTGRAAHEDQADGDRDGGIRGSKRGSQSACSGGQWTRTSRSIHLRDDHRGHHEGQARSRRQMPAVAPVDRGTRMRSQ